MYACNGKKACIGGLPQTCSENYDESVQACSKCDKDYFNNNGDCQKCDGGNIALPAILIGVGILLLGAAYILCNSPHNPHTGPLLFTCIALGMVVIATQSLSVMNEVFNFEKEPLQSMMSVTTFVRFNKDLWRVDCVMEATTMGLFIGTNMMPNFVVIVYAGGFVTALLLATITGNQTRWMWAQNGNIWAPFHPTRFLNALGLIIQTLFVVVTLNCLEPFTCSPNPNGTTSMALFRDTTCSFEGDHMTMVILSLVFFAVYSLGFFIYCFWLARHLPVWAASEEGSSGHWWFKACSFLYRRFRPDSYYFGVIVLGRNFLIAVVPTVSSSASIQLVVLGAILVVSMVVTCRQFPWSTKGLNYIDIAVLGLLTLMVIGAHVFVPTPTEDIQDAFVWILVMALTKKSFL